MKVQDYCKAMLAEVTAWSEKLEANQKRDGRNYETLAASGWRVLVVWECAIKGRDEEELVKLGTEVVNWLKSDNRYGEKGSVISQC